MTHTLTHLVHTHNAHSLLYTNSGLSITHSPCQMNNKGVLLSCYRGLSDSRFLLPLFSPWSALLLADIALSSPPFPLCFVFFPHFLSLSTSCAFPHPLLLSFPLLFPPLPLWQMKGEISSSLWSGWDWHTPTGLAVGGVEEGSRGFRRKGRRWEELWGERRREEGERGEESF